VPGAEPDELPTEVTVVNYASWAGRVADLARVLRTTAGRQGHPRVIPDPTGRAADPDQLLVVTDPTYWASRHQELAEVISGHAGGRARDTGQGLGAAGSSQTRLTLTVEEAAAALGISRASAYEAVRRSEIPSLRIGRRVLVPRVALNRMLDIITEHNHDPGE
jgi:excisionase family DNA binding protein